MIKRYLQVKDAIEYYSICRATIMKLSEKANAIRKIGRRILIDREILDDYLKNQ